MRESHKRARFDSHQDTIPIQGDHGLIHHQEGGLNSSSLPTITPPSPQKIRTAWTIGETWLEDDETYALDESGVLYEEELNKEGWEFVHEAVPGTKKRKRTRNPRSEISVSLLLPVEVILVLLIINMLEESA